MLKQGGAPGGVGGPPGGRGGGGGGGQQANGRGGGGGGRSLFVIEEDKVSGPPGGGGKIQVLSVGKTETSGRQSHQRGCLSSPQSLCLPLLYSPSRLDPEVCSHLPHKLSPVFSPCILDT